MVERQVRERLREVFLSSLGDPIAVETEVGEFGQPLTVDQPGVADLRVAEFEGDEIRQPLQTCEPP
jgi:hypothetical protein